MREIGREIAKEVERIFEANVNPRTIEKRAERMNATNVAPRQPDKNIEIFEDAKSRLANREANSIRDASRQIADETGESVETVRNQIRLDPVLNTSVV